MSREEIGQYGHFRPDGSVSGGPTPTGTASNTWPNFQPQPVVTTFPSRHCPSCTCGNHYYYYPVYPHYQHWPPPWIVYTVNS